MMLSLDLSAEIVAQARFHHRNQQATVAFKCS